MGLNLAIAPWVMVHKWAQKGGMRACTVLLSHNISKMICDFELTKCWMVQFSAPAPNPTPPHPTPPHPTIMETPHEHTHNQVLAWRRVEALPLVWVLAPKGKKQGSPNGKMPGSAAHHGWVTLGDPERPGPALHPRSGEHPQTSVSWEGLNVKHAMPTGKGRHRGRSSSLK